MMMVHKKTFPQIKDFLEESYLKFNNRSFIENDPVSIPHQFIKKEDIEISAFFSATIAWGNRKSIINNAGKLMRLMDNAPFDFVINHSKKELKPFETFVHRTFNGKDCIFFIESLKNIYKNQGGLESTFTLSKPVTSNTLFKPVTSNTLFKPVTSNTLFKPVTSSAVEKLSVKNRIVHFRKIFLQTKHLTRSEKHISNPDSNSSAKRLCMFLRWMARQDKKGVDFGIWKSISPKELCLPLDVHTGNVSRALGLLQRKQNDWKAVEEITEVLRTMDANDPVKYDFALFGLGVDGFVRK